jgi:hypothetical protein
VNPVVLQIASGNAFFIGLGLTVIAFALRLWLNSRVSISFWNVFGADQRVLAKKYGATLIPKRCLAGVFGSPGATVDGLHLSQQGHNLLARTVFSLLIIEDPVETTKYTK